MEIIVDTHVHIYPSYDLTAFLNSAFENLKSCLNDSSKEWLGVLCLTERRQERFFVQLKEGRILIPGWRLSSLGELLLAERQDGSRLLICPGFQIVTKERIEVLQLLTVQEVGDGMSLHDTCDGSSAITVLPWSPGKWLFHRGKIVAEAIREFGDRVFIGDIWLRADLFGVPSQFKLGVERGMKILAGSDPLMMAREELRVGAYAIRFEGEIDWSNPARSLIQLFRSAAPAVAGKRASLAEAVSTIVRQKVSKYNGSR